MSYFDSFLDGDYIYCSYADVALSFCNSTELWEEDGDYQGSSHALIRKNDSWAYLTFSWGSCSFCDALQSCESVQELEDLAASLESSCRWFNSPRKVLDYVSNGERAGEHYYHYESFPDFLEKLKTFVKDYKGND